MSAAAAAAAAAGDQAQPSTANNRPSVLISNDDGIEAPGLRVLVQHLAAADCCDVYVSAPSGERSAQSHAITLGRYLSCSAADVPGATAAFAVDGTPADAVMLALNSPVFGGRRFDLCASGINRGDNCGLHVIYSGTVGAAREAACKGVPAVALSLADHGAKRPEHYEACASLAAELIRVLLDDLQTSSPAPAPAPAPAASEQQPQQQDPEQQQPQQQQQAPHWEAGCVVNINFPSAAAGPLAGLALTHQGEGCVFPKFIEIQEQAGPHLAEVEEHTANIRVFRNYAGWHREDHSEGSDTWAVKRGWVSVTPLSLRSDVPLRLEPACHISASARLAVAGIVHRAAESLQLRTHGLGSLLRSVA